MVQDNVLLAPQAIVNFVDGEGHCKRKVMLATIGHVGRGCQKSLPIKTIIKKTYLVNSVYNVLLVAG